MGKVKKRPFPKKPPPLPCKEGAVRTFKCADETVIDGWKCVRGRWKRTSEKCADGAPLPAVYCCDLLQAVVFNPRCVSFWLGECNV